MPFLELVVVFPPGVNAVLQVSPPSTEVDVPSLWPVCVSNFILTLCN